MRGISAGFICNSIAKRFEAGFKAGYEAGFGALKANKWIAAPYLQYNFSSKWSLAIQPGIRSGNVRGIQLPARQTYYRQGSTAVSNDTTRIPTSGMTVYQSFEHTYDSIIISHKASTSVFEVEIPLIFRYRLSESFSVSAGVNFITGRTVEVREQRETYTGQKQIAKFIIPLNSIPLPPDTSNSFNHSALPYSSYKPADQLTQSSNPLRAGYIASLMYTRKRLLAELVIQQTLSGYGNIPAGLRNIYTRPYFRLMVGYRIIK